ncbi:MAG: response regulator [Candidatus Sulfobium sp.]|jgi:DNA-binding NtrC family response regulator
MNRCVLIVDDDKLTCWGLEKMMSSHNLLITSVNNGTDAVSEVGSRSFNSVFLDINLPDISGFDVLKEIRTRAPQTKVIVITADGSDTNKRRALEEGAFHFVGKPFSVKEIRGILDSCLDECERGQAI